MNSAPTTEWMSFNVNSHVRVKLTSAGLAELRRQGEELRARFPKLPPYEPPKPDADGWYRFQAWNLMQDLGHLLHLGCSDQPFETEIQFEMPSSTPEPCGDVAAIITELEKVASQEACDRAAAVQEGAPKLPDAGDWETLCWNAARSLRRLSGEPGGEPAFLIRFDDRDRAPEIFMGGGNAETAARQRFDQVLSRGWNAHLFQRIDDGRRPLTKAPKHGDCPACKGTGSTTVHMTVFCRSCDGTGSAPNGPGKLRAP